MSRCRTLGKSSLREGPYIPTGSGDGDPRRRGVPQGTSHGEGGKTIATRVERYLLLNCVRSSSLGTGRSRVFSRVS